MLQVTPRDPPERRPSSSRALRDPPNASWERPGPPQDHPRPPQSPPRPPLGNSIRQALNRKSTIFRFYTFFQPFFNTFHLRKLLCKIALISFYTYFQLILTIFRIAQVNQTPPRTPPGPPQDLPGPPSGPSQRASESLPVYRITKLTQRNARPEGSPYSWYRITKF